MPSKTPTKISAYDTEVCVNQLYRSLLGREPDGASTEKVDRILSGKCTLSDMVVEFLSSEEYNNGERFKYRNRLTNDHTQFGELSILLKLMVNRTAKHKIVVDVGARGRERSNSYDLMKNFGWKGYLFEANANLVSSIEDDFQGCDYVLTICAISDYIGEAEFHLGINDDVSSLSSTAAESWGPTNGAVKVPVERLGDILADYEVPKNFDLISIDIEGEDIKVLNDLVENYGYRPEYVLIEASYDFSVKALEDLSFNAEIKAEYELVGQTPSNLILARRDVSAIAREDA